MYTIITVWSEKYLQIAIPIITGAFIHDIDITRYFNSKDLQFIANLTPCDKILDKCVYLNREYIFYRISTYIESGSMGHFSHDKGESYGIGIIVKVLGFNNWNYKLNPSLYDSIISVKVGADSVNSNANYIVMKLIKQKNILLIIL